MSRTIVIALLFLSLFTFSHGQVKTSDSIKLNYQKIYSFCLDANIPSALKEMNVDTNRVSAIDKKFITNFKDRFASTANNSNFLKEYASKIDSLLSIFHSYWRMSLINTSENFDSIFVKQINTFLSKAIFNSEIAKIKEDSLDYYFKQYIKAQHLYSTDGIGKTGKLYDLLVWTTQKDTTYSFDLNKEKISARVILMDNFITLGWEEYATLERYYPGGWATDKALFCVKKAYDLSSEDFLISYLAHESRHFSDYKLFPKLKNSAALEYRAKLTELSMAEKTIYELIDFFIANANYNSENGHSVANYCAIRDLSRALFGVEFEKDLQKWKNIQPDKLNKTAYKILQANTKEMQKIGSANIEKYINK
jgi:hypothetical protein